MKLQKQLSRKIGTLEYAKWVVVISPKIINQIGWKAGNNLKATIKDNMIEIKREKNGNNRIR